MSDTWEKHVDKAAKKFEEQVFKAAYQFKGSTFSYETAYVLAKAYAVMMKSSDAKEAEKQIFTPAFLSEQNIKEANKQ